MQNQNSLPIPTEGYLSFMSMRLPYTTFNGQYYVPIKPICDHIGFEHGWAIKRLQKDVFFSQLCELTHMVAEDGKRREMVCLPWKYLHGWLLGIDESRVNMDARPTLMKYKELCYDVLHDFFVGSAENMTKRRQMYIAIQIEKREIAILEGRLSTNEDFQKLMTKKKTYQKMKRDFDALDDDEFGSQLSLLD